MVYVGSAFATPDNSNCLINPKLSVASHADRGGSMMGYWPSYSSIHPRERRAYLDWLASGRQDKEIGIGYVFLFFYGLERRLFIDGAVEEIDVIAGETRRLLSLYGHNHSFKGYATRLLDTLSITKWQAGLPLTVSLDGRQWYELPNSLKMQIGYKIAKKEALSADEALMWVVCAPETSLRTPVTRCFEEFKSLWTIEFSKAYPDGLKVPEPKTRLTLSYRAAMGFSGTISTNFEGKSLPDITNIKAPLNKLRLLVELCTEALDPYSRYLGRNPEAVASIAAARLLPPDLIRKGGHAVWDDITGKLNTLLKGEAEGFVPVTVLADLFETGPLNGNISRAQSAQIGTALDKIGYGFEPDARYGASALSSDGEVYLFRAEHGAPVPDDASAYSGYRLMIEVIAIAAAADNQLKQAEFDVVETTLRDATALAETERMRLLGLATALWRNAPKAQTLLKKLGNIPDSDKRQIANTAVAAVLADGQIDPKEVAFLEKLFKALGYAETDVYATLHRGGTEELPSAAAVSSPIVHPANTIQLDPERLRRIRGETDVVSQMLANIFADEAASVAHTPAPQSADITVRITGLDAEHGQLFADVLAAGTLSRADFDAKARSLKLLPDGALETINEWGFETLDDLVLDGEDCLEIPQHLIDQIKDLVAV
jgi:tellurite resistance protein